MDELSGRIKELLKDPESVARIMSIAKSFGEGSQEKEVEKQEVQEEGAEDDMIAAVLKNPRLKKALLHRLPKEKPTSYRPLSLSQQRKEQKAAKNIEGDLRH